MRTITILAFLSIVTKAKFSINKICLTYLDYYTDATNQCWYNVAVNSDLPTIVRSYGYPLEIHKVLTSDQYILTVFRIPNTKFKASSKKEPVILMHGVFLSGAGFVGLGNLSLGLTLANNGYDVWIGNLRGTSYSLDHAKLSSNDNKFWDFNIDHYILNDIPAIIKYVAKKSEKGGRIIYIGYSLGTTVLLGYGSRFPKEASSLIKLSILLGPNGGMRNTKSVFFRVGVALKDIIRLLAKTNMAKVFAPNGILKTIRSVCRSTPSVMKACTNLLNLFNMGPEKETDRRYDPIVFNQFPDGTSLRVYEQISDQIVHEFRSYDYGPSNLFIYKQLTPPIYNVSKIEVPIYLIYSKNDWCTSSKDAEILFSKLQDKVKIYGKYEILDFNHNDFLYSNYAKAVIYDKILKLIDSVR